MSSVALQAVDTRPFWLRRLHSLVGIIPLGAWIVYHFNVHSYSHAGPEVYNAKLAAMYASPMHLAVSIFLVYLPLLYHSIYGLVVTRQAQPNFLQYSTIRNWIYVLQRVSGIGLLLFIPAHLVKARFSEFFLNEQMSWAHEAAGFAMPLTIVVYLLGIFGVAFHLGNGLFLFGFHWGLWVTERAQKVAAAVSVLLFLALAGMGIYAMIGFMQ
jgi:succinate dehydrogenase / fumarate reductase cytochrome b subunit